MRTAKRVFIAADMMAMGALKAFHEVVCDIRKTWQ